MANGKWQMAKAAVLAVLAALVLLAGARTALSVDLITATIVVTNKAGVLDSQTLTVNGDVRTWTTNVTTPATQIATNNTDLKSATNLFFAIAAAPFNGLTLSRYSTNGILLRAAPGGALSVTLSAGWGTVSLATNTLTAAIAVRVPYSVETAAVRTNVASGLVKAIDGPESTNAIHESSPVAVNLVGIGNAQTVTGAKQFTSSGNSYVGSGSGLTSVPPGVLTNNDARGAKFYTDVGGAVTFAGTGNVATVSFVGESLGGSTASISCNPAGLVLTAGTVFLGGNLNVGGHNINAANYTGSGSNLTDIASVTSATIGGTNNITGDVAFKRLALTSLANGNNAAVPVGTNVFVEVSGPSGAFTINGIAGGRDGKFLIIVNQTTFNMTIAHDSGTDPTAANRIYSMTGADRATTGNGAAMLIYSGAASRWILISLDL